MSLPADVINNQWSRQTEWCCCECFSEEWLNSSEWNIFLLSSRKPSTDRPTELTIKLSEWHPAPTIPTWLLNSIPKHLKAICSQKLETESLYRVWKAMWETSGRREEGRGFWEKQVHFLPLIDSRKNTTFPSFRYSVLTLSVCVCVCVVYFCFYNYVYVSVCV